jgi:hypothetical protein
MKIIGIIFAGVLFLFSTILMAESHLDTALEHANVAVTEGQAGKVPKLLIHAKAALEHSLAASVVARSVTKTHIDAASISLQNSIDHGNLNHVEPATTSAQEAVNHLEAAKKQ